MIKGLDKTSEKLSKELTRLGFRWENRKVLSKEKAALIIKMVFEVVLEQLREDGRFFISNFVKLRTVKKNSLNHIEFLVKKKGDPD